MVSLEHFTTQELRAYSKQLMEVYFQLEKSIDQLASWNEALGKELKQIHSKMNLEIDKVNKMITVDSISIKGK